MDEALPLTSRPEDHEIQTPLDLLTENEKLVLRLLISDLPPDAIRVKRSEIAQLIRGTEGDVERLYAGAVRKLGGKAPEAMPYSPNNNSEGQ